MGKKVHVGGRPSLANISEIDKRALEIVASEGYTDKQIAKLLSVTEQTVNNYKLKYPGFFESLKRGKDIADAKVEIALFQRAVGYSHPDVSITNYQGKALVTPIIKHYPPDPTSMIFWLKNRKKEEWREKQEVEWTKPFEIVISDYRGRTETDATEAIGQDNEQGNGKV